MKGIGTQAAFCWRSSLKKVVNLKLSLLAAMREPFAHELIDRRCSEKWRVVKPLWSPVERAMPGLKEKRVRRAGNLCSSGAAGASKVARSLARSMQRGVPGRLGPGVKNMPRPLEYNYKKRLELSRKTMC